MDTDETSYLAHVAQMIRDNLGKKDALKELADDIDARREKLATPAAPEAFRPTHGADALPEATAEELDAQSADEVANPG